VDKRMKIFETGK